MANIVSPDLITVFVYKNKSRTLNLLKSHVIACFLDSLNNFFYEDDSQVVQLSCTKQYSLGEGYTTVTIKEVRQDSAEKIGS